MAKKNRSLTPYVEDGVEERKGKQRPKGEVFTVANIDLNRVMEMYGQEVARRAVAEYRLAELTVSPCTASDETIETEWQEKEETE